MHVYVLQTMQRIRVESANLRNSRRSVDLLKIDVERTELQVLAGVDAVHWPLVRQVYLHRRLGFPLKLLTIRSS